MAKATRNAKPRPSRTVQKVLPPEAVEAPVEVDWRDYHERFKQTHGVWWVEYENRLLFPDGWSCAADDYAGPYWPPPRDVEDMENLLRVYWRRRYVLVKGLADKLEGEVQHLRRLQRELPLELSVVRRSVVPGEDGSFMVLREPQPVPWFDKVDRLKWLVGDVQRCKDELLLLGVLV